MLGQPQDSAADLVILVGSRPSWSGRTVTLACPKFHPPTGPDRALAEAYRAALALANDRGARSLELPAVLARGPWPLESVTRIALTVIMSTPTSLQEVIVVASNPSMLERWAEALVREPDHRHPG